MLSRHSVQIFWYKVAIGLEREREREREVALFCFSLYFMQLITFYDILFSWGRRECVYFSRESDTVTVGSHGWWDSLINKSSSYSVSTSFLLSCKQKPHSWSLLAFVFFFFIFYFWVSVFIVNVHIFFIVNDQDLRVEFLKYPSIIELWKNLTKVTCNSSKWCFGRLHQRWSQVTYSCDQFVQHILFELMQLETSKGREVGNSCNL